MDDYKMLAGRAQDINLLGGIIFFWTAVGIPLRWDKSRGGTEVEWIGFFCDYWGSRLGISLKRATWLIDWMRKQVAARSADMADFTAVLGRLCFTMGPLDVLRPFVTPLYKWAAVAGMRGRRSLPWSVCFLLSFLSSELENEGRVDRVRAIVADEGIAFKADAKAEGQLVVVGGWECRHGARPATARWFSVTLDKKTAPWAFGRGEPFRAICVTGVVCHPPVRGGVWRCLDDRGIWRDDAYAPGLDGQPGQYVRPVQAHVQQVPLDCHLGGTCGAAKVQRYGTTPGLGPS